MACVMFDKHLRLCYNPAVMDGKLRRIREKRLLTQEELARLSGLTLWTISRIETGAHKPRFSTIKRLAQALGVEPEKLVEKVKG